MNRFLTILLFCSIVMNLVPNASAQKGSNDVKRNMVLTPVSNKALVVSVYPEAMKVEKVNNYWYRVLDAQGKTLGFAMNGEPFCKEEKGYNAPTPIMVITDRKGIIKKVDLLSHYETAGYVAKLHKKGFFDAWNNKSLQEAKEVKVDGYTGATMTAKSVIKNMQYLLNNGLSQFPKK